jgi:hypothetical protein
MKGKTQIFAVLSILFLFFLQPLNSTANQKTNKSEIHSLFSASGKFSFNFLLHYQRVLKDGVWWIYVYDGAKLIDAYPE